MTFPNIAWSPARMATRVLAPCVIVLVLMLLPLIAHAGTITVDGTTCTLPEAITAANTDAAFEGCTAGSGPDTLLLGGLTHSLATGTYAHDGKNATPSVTSNIVISGGVGGAIVERSGTAKYRLFHVSETGDLTLQNVMVRFGSGEGVGGAIVNYGTLSLLDSELISNTASSGGALFNYQSIATLTNTMIASNITPKGHGGGIYNQESTITILNSDFIANTVGSNQNPSAALGGAIYNVSGKLNISDSDFIANKAVLGSGGGIFTTSTWDCGFLDCFVLGTITISNTRFISNTSDHTGGGIFARDFDVTITDSEFRANTAKYEGGGFLNAAITNTTTSIVNSIFISNTAGTSGGGLLNSTSSSSMTIVDSAFRANTAGDGGGGFYNFGPATLTNSDFISNMAAYGGGIYGSGYDSMAITITNATIRANVAITSGGAIYKGNGARGDSGSATITGSRFISNYAGITGGTIHQLDGTTTIEQSCIIDNTDTAVNYVDGDPIDVTNNWWGVTDGPSGEGSGTGDSVSIGVNFEPFLTTPVAGCPWLTAMVTASTIEATVGETITFTYRITNSSSLTLTTISAVDDQFDPVEALEGPLMPAASRSVTLTHVVEPDDLPGPLTSSVTVTGTDTFGLVVTASDSISVTTLPAVIQPGEIYLPNMLR